MPPKHDPNDFSRGQVCAWTSAGISQDVQAALLGISPKTLREHYRTELDNGKEMAHATVAGELMKLCKKGNFRAIEFWLRAQAKWRTTHEVEVKGKLTFSDYIGQFTEEDLERDD